MDFDSPFNYSALRFRKSWFFLDGAVAVLFLNADTNKTQDLSVSLAGLGLTGGLSVRDVWEKSDAGQTSTSAGNFTAHAIPPQDSKLLLFKPSKEALETQLEPGRFSFAPLSRLAMSALRGHVLSLVDRNLVLGDSANGVHQHDVVLVMHIADHAPPS